MKAEALRKTLFFLAIIQTAGCALPKDDDANTCAISANIDTQSQTTIADPALGGDELAQGFKLTQATSFKSLSLKLVKIGTLSDEHTVSVSIVRAVNGTPDTVVLASGTISVRAVAVNTPNFYAAALDHSLTLTPGSYFVRVRASYPSSSTNAIRWLASDGRDYFADGQALYETSVSNQFSSNAFGSFRDFVFALGSC